MSTGFGLGRHTGDKVLKTFNFGRHFQRIPFFEHILSDARKSNYFFSKNQKVLNRNFGHKSKIFAKLFQ